MRCPAWYEFEKRNSRFSISTQLHFFLSLSLLQLVVEEKDGRLTKLEILEVREKMGKLRKAVPTLPICIAILLCFVNTFLPGVGKVPLFLRTSFSLHKTRFHFTFFGVPRFAWCLHNKKSLT